MLCFARCFSFCFLLCFAFFSVSFFSFNLLYFEDCILLAWPCPWLFAFLCVLSCFVLRFTSILLCSLLCALIAWLSALLFAVRAWGRRGFCFSCNLLLALHFKSEKKKHDLLN